MVSQPGRRVSGLSLAIAIAAVMSGSVAHAQEWTRFRGPNGTGISSASLPDKVSPADYNWRIELPGVGHSSPVLWGSKLFVTSAEEEKGRRHLLCIDAASGKTLWTNTVTFKPYHRHEFNSAASSTPTVDAERVYTVWSTQDLFSVTALDHAGKEVWSKSFGTFPTQHGGGNSPIVVGDLLILAMEPEDNTGGAILGLDRKTGEVRWRHERPKKQPAPYGTPILRKNASGQQEVLFASTAFGVTALDPSTGKLLWESGPLSDQRSVAGLVENNGLLFVTHGVGGGARLTAALRPGGAQSPKVEYQLTKGTSYVPTPIALGKNIYYWGDGGVVLCTRAETGETVWQERVGGNFFGSPVCANGKLYAISAKGELAIIEASDQFKLLGRCDFEEECRSTPAIANGTMYVRTVSHLISIGGKRTAKSNGQ